MQTQEDIIWRIVDDEALILNTRTGYYFSMNGTATEIWCLLNEGKSEDETAKAIAERYKIDAQTAKSDVDELKRTLTEEKIAVF
jgi:hypothetical protein